MFSEKRPGSKWSIWHTLSHWRKVAAVKMKITVRGLWIKGQTFTCISLQRFGTHLHMCFKYIKHVLLSSLRQNSQVKIRCEAGSSLFDRNAFILKLSPKPPQSTMANSQDISRFLGKQCWTPWERALSNSQSQNQIALHSFRDSVCLSIWMSGGGGHCD